MDALDSDDLSNDSGPTNAESTDNGKHEPCGDQTTDDQVTLDNKPQPGTSLPVTQPGDSGSKTNVTENDETVDRPRKKVQFLKLKHDVKMRNFRGKNRISSDDDSSSDEDSNTNNLPERNQNTSNVDTSAPRQRSSSEDSTVISETDMISETDLEDESTVESSDSFQKLDTHAYEKMCNPKLPANWFALSEIMRRQQGYSAKLNGHVQFQRRYYGSLHVAQRFELMAMMEYHDGCVNALGFNPTGTLLASASDDLRVVIWDWARGKRKTSWVTRHRSNVFQSKFLHLSSASELQLVTSARDGQVWLWQLGQEGLRGSRKLGMHRSASHKLALPPEQPHVILSCGEDALIYSHDVRETKSNKLTYASNKEGNRIPLYSIHSHPLISTEFCVSGHDPAVGVYDQRFITSDGLPMKSFEIDHIQIPDRHVTASVYNYCGSEILASYNDDDIYLFDSSQPGNKFIHYYQGHRNGATIKGVNFFGPRSEYVISGSDCGNIFFWDKSSQGIVQFMLADKGVVNCLEPHPSMPVLASSGIDSDVKIWLPSREYPHKMPELLKTVTNNLRLRTVTGRGQGDHSMIWMLWRVMQRSHHPNYRRRSTSNETEERMDEEQESRGDGSDANSEIALSDSDSSDNDEQRINHLGCVPS